VLNSLELGGTRRERRFYGIDFVKEAEEQVRAIQRNMTSA
jgi:hypothetical protein